MNAENFVLSLEVRKLNETRFLCGRKACWRCYGSCWVHLPLDIRLITIEWQIHSLSEALDSTQSHNEAGQAEKFTAAARDGLVRQARLTWKRRFDMLAAFQPNIVHNRESMLVKRKLHALLTESNWDPESKPGVPFSTLHGSCSRDLTSARDRASGCPSCERVSLDDFTA